MEEYTTNTPRRAPGNGFEPRKGVLCAAPRLCATCGAPLVGRRRQTRYCNPTCRGRAFDAKHHRKAHTAKGGEL